MQAYLVHYLVHNECRTGHIAGILHEGYEQIEDKDIGQKDDNSPHTAYDAVHDEVFQRAVGHNPPQPCSQRTDTMLYPLHRVCAEHECRLEHHPHDEEKYRISPHLMGDDGINDIRRLLLLVRSRRIGLLQGARYETVFLIGDGRLDVLSQLFLDTFHLPVAQTGPLGITGP